MYTFFNRNVGLGATEWLCFIMRKVLEVLGKHSLIKVLNVTERQFIKETANFSYIMVCKGGIVFCNTAQTQLIFLSSVSVMLLTSC